VLLCQTGGNVAVAAAETADMALIPAGHFMMGSTPAEATRDKVTPEFAELQLPQHEVSVPSFLLAKHDVTRAEFAAFVSATGYASVGCNVWDGVKWAMVARASWQSPGFDQTDRDPVVCVSLADVDAYARWYSTKMGRVFRLPSEALRRRARRRERLDDREVHGALLSRRLLVRRPLALARGDAQRRQSGRSLQRRGVSVSRVAALMRR